MPFKKHLRKVLILGVLVATFVVIAAGALLLQGRSKDIRTWKEPTTFRTDAGRLDSTGVGQVILVSSDTAMAYRQIREALARARREGLKIAISGARHSMGGQSVFPRGIVLDMLDCNRMEMDSAGAILHVQSGARWSDVIPYLDARGYSVEIMQSNNPFTIGGTLSVNAHGWQQNRPPFVSSVLGFDLVGADGVVPRHCSRTQNRELFRLAAGGYGLFGVIVGVNLKVIPNAMYRAERVQLDARAYPGRFHDWVDGDTAVGLAYGRLSISPRSFLREALLTRYVKVSEPLSLLVPMPGESRTERVKRWIFLASVGSDWGKEARWLLESWLGGESASLATRNQILNNPIDLFENHDSTRTQLLHEYFVPRDSLEPFLTRARRIIPAHRGDLLNLTVRNLQNDTDAYLNYAREPVFSLVLLFSQKVSAQDEKEMKAMTRELIDAALDAGGTFYLPYRLHATPRQFRLAYPQAREFFALKRKYDPHELLQNKFYLEYGTDPKFSPGKTSTRKENTAPSG